MNIEYPHNNRKQFNYLLYRLILKYTFIISAVICFIINLCIGKGYWSFIVAGSLVLTWIVFVSKTLIEKTLEQKLVNIVYGIAILFAILDLINKTKLLNNVFPIILFSLMILQILIFLKDLRYQNVNIMPLLYSLFISLIIYTLIVFKVFVIKWSIIVSAGLSILFPIISIIFCRKIFIVEIKKRFSTK